MYVKQWYLAGLDEAEVWDEEEVAEQVLRWQTVKKIKKKINKLKQKCIRNYNSSSLGLCLT